MIALLWQKFGHFAYWICSPLLAIYLRIGSRTRIVVRHEEDILVVRQWLGDNKWSLPGGGLHRREDPNIGVLRELYEETGVHLDEDSLQIGGEAMLKKGIFKFHYFRFHVQLAERPVVRPQKWEVQEVTWLPINSFNDSNADQTLLDTLSSFNAVSTSVTM